jgi:hypothetical protein
MAAVEASLVYWDDTYARNLNDLLEAVRVSLVGGTALDASAIVEWYGSKRPRYEGYETTVAYRLLDFRPEQDPGGAKLYDPAWHTLEVRLWTRYAADRAGSHKQWARDTSRGHYLRALQVVNALHLNMLWSSYDDDGEPEDGASALTDEPIRLTRWEYVEHHPDEETHGMSRFLFEVRAPLRVDNVYPTPPLD